MPKQFKSDLDKVRAKSAEEIERAALEDPDAPPMTDEQLSGARLMRLEDFLPAAKEQVCLRLDKDVLEWFRKQGRGYQTRINAALKAFIATQGQPGKRRPSPRG